MSTNGRRILLSVRPPDRMFLLPANLPYDLILAPSLEYENINPLVPDLEDVDALLVTSARALEHLGADWDRARKCPVYIVGVESARRAQAAGFNHIALIAPDVMGLVDALAICPPHRLLYVRGDQVAQDLADVLTPYGHQVTQITTYQTVPLEQLSESAYVALGNGHVRGVLFFSPASAAHFCKLVDKADLTPHLPSISALCLSPAVLRSLTSNHWADVQVATTPDLSGMMALIQTLPPAKG